MDVALFINVEKLHPRLRGPSRKTTAIRRTNWRLLASWGPIKGLLETLSDHYSTMLLRGLMGALN